MFDFDKFPARLRYEKVNNKGDVILEREVEVFGGFYFCDLMAFREIDVVQAPVCWLPVSEFNERFKDYAVVVE